MATRSENLQGAALMSGAMACYTINDAFLKVLSDDVPFFQLLFLRGVATTVLMFIIAKALGMFDLRMTRRDWFFAALRTLGEVGAAYCFISALFNMPIANVSAILQALPLTVTLAGAVFLREQVGWRRWLAILVGFVGVLLIVRPGVDGFNIYGIYALGAVGFVTLRDIATRGLAPGVSSMTVAWMASAGVMVFGGLGAVGTQWAPMSAWHWGLLLGSAIFIQGGYLMAVMVMRTGEIAFVTPFRYTSLLWALILGLLIFNDWPDALTMLGASIVVATGLFTLWRESRLKQAE